MGNFEVLSEEFVGEAEEGLVLGGELVSWRDSERVRVFTRIRWLSALSFEVMWSAMIAVEGEQDSSR